MPVVTLADFEPITPFVTKEAIMMIDRILGWLLVVLASTAFLVNGVVLIQEVVARIGS